MSAWTHHDVPKRQLRNIRVTTTTPRSAPAPAPVSVAPTAPPVPFEPDPDLWVSKAEWDEVFAMLFEVVNPHPSIKAQLVAGMKRIDERKIAKMRAEQEKKQ